MTDIDRKLSAELNDRRLQPAALSATEDEEDDENTEDNIAALLDFR